MLFCSVLLLTSVTYADWLDDMVVSVGSSNSFDADKTLGVIQKYVDQDKKEIELLEKQELENTEDGVLAKVRGGTYTMALFSARSSLKSHEHVAKFIKELSANKKDRDKFVAKCVALNKLNMELIELQKEYEKEKHLAKKTKLGALITAKKLHIEGKKAIMKTFSI